MKQLRHPRLAFGHRRAVARLPSVADHPLDGLHWKYAEDRRDPEVTPKWRDPSPSYLWDITLVGNDEVVLDGADPGG